MKINNYSSSMEDDIGYRSDDSVHSVRDDATSVMESTVSSNSASVDSEVDDPSTNEYCLESSTKLSFMIRSLSWMTKYITKNLE